MARKKPHEHQDKEHMMSTSTQVAPLGVLVAPQQTHVGEQPIPNLPDKVFVLQTDAWASLQTFTATALQLPVLKDKFEERYGTFEDTNLIQQAIPHLQALQAAANKYGDVITESKNLIDAIGQDKTPEVLFVHAVWLASKIESSAMQISNMVGPAIALLEREDDPAKRAQDIQQLLTWPGYGMYTYAVDLNEKSLTFKDELNDYLEKTFKPASDAFDKYCEGEDSVLAHANKVVADDKTKIGDLTLKVDKLNKDLLGWSIGGTIGTVVLAFTPPFFILGAIALGSAEIEECVRISREIDDLNAQLANLTEDKKKKGTLVTDFTALINQSKQVSNAADAFIKAVTEMAEGFGLCAEDLKTLSNSITPQDVQQLPPFLQNTGLAAAEGDWRNIQIACNNFIAYGQYQYKTS